MEQNPILLLGDYSKTKPEGYRKNHKPPEGTTWTAKLRNDILMFQQRHGESLSEAWTRLKDLLQKLPHYGIELWLQVQIFYSHVNPVTRRTIDQSAGGKLRDLNPEEYKTILEDLSPMTMKVGTTQGISLSRSRQSLYLKMSRIKPEKSLLDFDSNKEKRLSHLRTQLEQQQDDMIRKINLLWKTVSEILNDTSPPKNTGNSIAPKSITAISHDEKEELRKKGIKRPSKLLSPKYLSPASIEELKQKSVISKTVHNLSDLK
ncbi:hypothetical protein Tco_1335542 [Tanacetum coccineum]